MAFVGVYDTVAVRPADELTLTLDGPFAEALDETLDEKSANLILRAARTLARACGVRAGAEIRLTKRLPVASGLGGGSADAAAAIKALSALWGASLAPGSRTALALELGADVPFCLAGETAYIGGVGDEITAVQILPADAPLPWAVLANPRRPLSTQAVFRARKGEFSEPGRIDESPGDAAQLAALLKCRRNDLTDAAVSLLPEIGDVIEALDRLPGCLLARMSGSGATCFALFASEEPARRGASDLAAAEKGWWVAAAPLLSRARDLAPEPSEGV